MGSAPRLRRRSMDQGDHGRRHRRRRSRALCLSPPYGGARVDCRRLGRVREQPQGEVLPTHREGATRARRQDRGVRQLRGRRLQGASRRRSVRNYSCCLSAFANSFAFRSAAAPSNTTSTPSCAFTSTCALLISCVEGYRARRLFGRRKQNSAICAKHVASSPPSDGGVKGTARAWSGGMTLCRTLESLHAAFGSSLLFGITASDVSTYGAAAFVLVLVTVIAAYLPARRTLVFDAAMVLRGD